MPPNAESRQKCVMQILKRLSACKEEIITVEQCEQRLRIGILPMELEHSKDPNQLPSYFRPIPLDWMESHPIRDGYLENVMRESPDQLILTEYDPVVAGKHGPEFTVDERLAAAPVARLQQITDIIRYHIYNVCRENMPPGTYALGHARRWDYTCQKNPLAKAYYDRKDLPNYLNHPTVMIYEVDDQTMPHVTMGVEHYNREEAGNNDIQVHELASMLQVMSLRYGQPEFEQFEVIPVLLVSLMSPQHGRILEGSLHQRKLIVRKSRLYSFETNQDAPIELFVRWLFGDPIATTSISQTRLAFRDRPES
ncbi:hypothetical protein BDV28DRAFT_100294 [Aspergillus coremiiformis]|uniref:Uncharacterized protein n=1 Tax=Aspergillus coremiiformis TaxID=138285 RepID=A0A5N6Z828_9EURO|nr:hypothetical protein BDV28DRAFT_100294 [Aspergillus coremiiformis]